jgi:hypothetical protein
MSVYCMEYEEHRISQCFPPLWSHTWGTM